MDYVRGKAAVICINNTYQLAPWGDVLYACDAQWWRWHKGAPDFQGFKYAVEPKQRAGRKEHAAFPDVMVLRNTGDDGLETEPTGLRTGKNSGYQAINLAVHFGAKRIVLLGYDMAPAPDGRDHYFGAHPSHAKPPYQTFLRGFPNIVEPLRKLNVEVINCSRKTALTCFPRRPLREVLQ